MKRKLILIVLALPILFFLCVRCTSKKDVRQVTSISTQNSVKLPNLLVTESNGEKLYLDSLNETGLTDSFTKKLLSSDYLKNNIGANDILLKYTIRDELNSKLRGNKSIIERSYIGRYVPTGYGDFHLYTLLVSVNAGEYSINSQPNLVWENRGMLSSLENDIECDVLKLYRKGVANVN